ncbi:MAG: cupin domain-containing protein [Xanthomonadales bacterium]|nr:cupin domain-containing protein [Xanthomonadales bacterium]
MNTTDGLQPPASFPLGKMTAAIFLRDYWQKKPCLLRAVWPEIENCLPVNADELAGIAAEENTEARLISGTHTKRNWKVEYGPFESQDYTQLGETDWTLLVQDVEKHYPPLKQWLSNFRFLPSWRLDDIMISFAASGGSVGPHTDQYDVFLFQASGKRRWQISDTYNPELLDHEEIKVLREFNADQSWDLEPGDLLYLPPNVAHFGVALEPCLSYSIGLRAPSRAELFAHLAEWFARSDDQGGRYEDADLISNDIETSTGEVDPQAIMRVQQLLNSSFSSSHELTQNPDLADWFCQFICAYRLSGSPEPAHITLTESKMAGLLADGGVIYRNPWSRFCWRSDNNSAWLYATAMKIECQPQLAELICESADTLDLKHKNISLNTATIQVITALYNKGHFFFENND